MALIKLQRLTSEQLPAAVELDQCCLGGLWTLDGYRRELDSPNSDLLVFARHEQFPVSPLATSDLCNYPALIGLGCLWAILDEAHITILAIHPDYQGQGLGQALLYALLKSAWMRKLERATLEVRVSNHRALSLYRSFGFKQAGRQPKYYQDTGEDALILWLGGLQHPKFEQTLNDWSQKIRNRFNRHSEVSQSIELVNERINSEISFCTDTTVFPGMSDN